MASVLAFRSGELTLNRSFNLCADAFGRFFFRILRSVYARLKRWVQTAAVALTFPESYPFVGVTEECINACGIAKHRCKRPKIVRQNECGVPICFELSCGKQIARRRLTTLGMMTEYTVSDFVR